MLLDATIIGHLGQDPTTRHHGGDSVTSFDVATSRKARGADPITTWVRVSAWGRLGELCAEHLAKGAKVYVHGALRTTTFSKRDGSPGFGLEVTAAEVRFLDSKADRDTRGHDHHDDASPNPGTGDGDISF